MASEKMKKAIKKRNKPLQNPASISTLTYLKRDQRAVEAYYEHGENRGD